MYRIEFTHSARKQLHRLDSGGQKRIVERMEKLSENPRPPGVRKLAGTTAFYRLRVGDYRVIYSIEEGNLVVLVLKVGHRGDVYRK